MLQQRWIASALGSTPLNAGSTPWNAAAGAGGAANPPDEIAASIRGMLAYRQSPLRRDAPDRRLHWQLGSSKLYEIAAGDGCGRAPLLLLPSLINPAYILDLEEDWSFAAYLGAAGHAVYLLDWGAPIHDDPAVDFDRLIDGVLRKALTALPAPPVVLGYCMGGLIALALASLAPDRLRGLVALASPYDFHAEDAAEAARLAELFGAWRPMLSPATGLPVDWLQCLFALIDPDLVPAKFRRFAALAEDSEAARRFVIVEDWLNGGAALPLAIAETCLQGWYGENQPATGSWQVAGQTVDPAQLNLPALAVIPARDRIVPAASARALVRALPGCVAIEPDLGHIGLMTARRAAEEAWPAIRAWLDSIAAA